MNIKYLGVVLSSLLALGHAKKYDFKVVSILGQGSSLGVKYGNTVKPLNATYFPLFQGSIEADKIEKYKYVSLDANGQVIREEDVEREYKNNKGDNEVFNRIEKEVEIPELPRPFKPMFPMGADNFKPIPNNVIYNVYAQCNEDQYSNVTSEPFIGGDTAVQNNQLVNCTFTIVSPKNLFRSEGTIHLIGFGSRLFKKLTWACKFDKKFLGRKAVKLRAMAADPSLVRENVSAELYKAAGIPIQEGGYARLFINGDTYGLYSIIDSFSKKWVAGYVHGDAKKDIGISYKLYAKIPRYPDFRYISDNYQDYTEFYLPDEYEEKDVNPNDIATQYPRLMEFIKKFNDWANSPNKSVKDLASFFNIEAVLRIMAIDTLILALDNFWLRMSNAALYYNPERNNYVLLPYDFDKVLNGGEVDPMIDPVTYISDCHTWVNQHEDTIDHYFTNTLLAHPEIKKRYDVILAKASSELFTRDNVNKYIHAVADLIRDDVQWNFDNANNLVIPYENGIVNQYTYQNFVDNLDYGVVGYQEGVIVNDSRYGVTQWTDIRSEACKADTKGVDTSKNDNISDDYKVEVFKSDRVEESGAISNLSIKMTFVILIAQLLFILF